MTIDQHMPVWLKTVVKQQHGRSMNHGIQDQISRIVAGKRDGSGAVLGIGPWRWGRHSAGDDDRLPGIEGLAR